MDATRSFEEICKDDLIRMAKLAMKDQEGLFIRRPELGAIYRSRLLGIMLCQGAALHYVQTQRRLEYPKLRGIKDFDLWCFYQKDPCRDVPYRRRGIADFGNPKFGLTSDSPEFSGRRIDIMMRAIPVSDGTEYRSAIRQYLETGKTKTARLLADRPSVTLLPEADCGQVIWMPDQNHMS